MTTITWGDPIEVNGLRPAWLGDDELVREGFLTFRADCQGVNWRRITHIRPPADHWAYSVIQKGFWPWAGGDEAPSDWVTGDEVLFRGGETSGDNWGPWKWGAGTGSHIIIGYKRRTDKKEEPTMTDYEAEAQKRVAQVQIGRVGYAGEAYDRESSASLEALCRVLEEMAEKDAKAEAFKREVSDAVEKYNTTWHKRTPSREEYMLSFGRFIIPKPDPVADVFHDVGMPGYEQHKFLEALAKRGYEIVKRGDTK